MSEMMTDIKIAMDIGVSAKADMSIGTIYGIDPEPGGVGGYTQSIYHPDSNTDGTSDGTPDIAFARFFSPISDSTAMAENIIRDKVYFDGFKFESFNLLKAMVVKYDLNTMLPVWTFEVPGQTQFDTEPGSTSMALDDLNEYIYIGCLRGDCFGGNLIKLDFDGNLIWQKDFLGSTDLNFAIFMLACDTSGFVYIGTNNAASQSTAGDFFKVDPDTAAVIWSKILGTGPTYKVSKLNYTSNFAMDVISLTTGVRLHEYGPPFGEKTGSRWDTAGNLIDAFNGIFTAPPFGANKPVRILATNRQDLALAITTWNGTRDVLAYRRLTGGSAWAAAPTVSINDVFYTTEGHIVAGQNMYSTDDGSILDSAIPTGAGLQGEVQNPTIWTRPNLVETAAQDGIGSVDSGAFLNPFVDHYVDGGFSAVNYIQGERRCQLGNFLGAFYFDNYPNMSFGAGTGFASFDYTNNNLDFTFEKADIWQRTSTNIPYPIIPWHTYHSGGPSLSWKAGRFCTFEGDYYRAVNTHSQATYVASALPSNSSNWTLDNSPAGLLQRFDTFPGWGGFGSISSNGKVETYVTPQTYTLAIDGLLRSATGLPFEGMFDVMHLRKTYGANRDNWQFEFNDSAITKWPIDINWNIFEEKSITNLVLKMSGVSALSFATRNNFGATMALYNENNDILVAGGTFSMYPGEVNEWNTNKQYSISDITALTGSFWISTSAHSGIEPPSASAWAAVTFGT